MNIFSYSIFGVIAAFGLIISGCSSMQPLASYARSGDTITIALGGTTSNALVPVLKKENLFVSIKDSAGNTFPVKVRNLFRIFSDPTSAYDFRSPQSPGAVSFSESQVPPHQGEWMAVLDLVDPATNVAPPLQPGAATLAVSSTEILNWVDPTGYGWTWTNGNLSSIPLEILSGAGSKNPLNFMSTISQYPLSSLEPQPQIEVSPSSIPSTVVGGAEIIFSYSPGNFPEGTPRPVATSPDPNVQLASQTTNQADGTALLKVMITNPHGFNTDNNKVDLNGNNKILDGHSLLRSLNFNIVWDKTNTIVTDSNWQSYIGVVSGKYVDLNGNSLIELAPKLTKVR